MVVVASLRRSSEMVTRILAFFWLRGNPPSGPKIGRGWLSQCLAKAKVLAEWTSYMVPAAFVPIAPGRPILSMERLGWRPCAGSAHPPENKQRRRYVHSDPMLPLAAAPYFWGPLPL